MCYTYNNYPQGMKQYLDQEVSNLNGKDAPGSYFRWPTWESITRYIANDVVNDQSKEKQGIRKARCGTYTGLQLIIDNQAMNNLVPKDVRSNGYHIYITTPGVVSSPLSFFVHPEFDGEHNFYIHGIHSISVSIFLYISIMILYIVKGIIVL